MNTKEAEWIMELLKREGITGERAIDVGAGDNRYMQKPQHQRLYHELGTRYDTIDALDMNISSSSNGIKVYKHDITKPIPSHLESQYDLAIVCNLLEHVWPSKRKSIMRNIDIMTKDGAYILITVPHIFPFHPRPIDTLYRPSTLELIDEVTAAIPCLEVISAEPFKTGWENYKQRIFQPFTEPENTGALFRKER